MKFLVDSMAGKLARWLRILGFDARYERSGDPKSLIEIAEEEGRIILTRNGAFRKYIGTANIFFLSSEIPELQLREVMDHFKLKDKVNPFTRCVECNVPLLQVSREDVKGKVPFFVYKTRHEFSRCPSCNRIYWRGTHVEAMERWIKKILGGDT